MNKIETKYLLVENQRWSVYLTESHESDIKRYSVHEIGEPCSGVLKHWDTKENLIKDLQKIISKLEKSK